MLGVVAATAPSLLAFNVAPSPTFLNQALAVAGWGWFVWGVAPSGRGAWTAAKPLWAALALLMGAVFVSSAWGALPWSLGASGLALLACAATLLASGAASRPLDEALRSFEAFCVGFAVAGVVNALIATVQVFAPSWPDGEWLALSGIPGRAVGNLRQPNHLSSLLTWSAVAVVALCALGRLSWRWAALLGSFIVVGVVLTASRTGTLSVLILALWGLADRRLPRPARVMLVLAPCVYAVAWGGLTAWSQSSQQAFGGAARLSEHDVSGSRFGIWSNTLTLIRMHPWWGVGFGEFNFAWSLTPFPGRPVAFFDHTHNLLLQFAVELGLPLAAAVSGLLLWALWRALWRAWRGRWQAEGPGGVASRSAWVMVLLMALHSQLEYPLWYAYFLLPCAWAWGFALATPLQPGLPLHATPWTRSMTLAAAALIMGAAGSVVDYRRVSDIFTSYDGAAPLSERIEAGKRSVFFAHHAHYAAATVTDKPSQAMDSLNQATHFLLDTRLMMAWSRAWHEAGDDDRASHLAQRLREFHNPASDEFFQTCLSSPPAMGSPPASSPALSPPAASAASAAASDGAAMAFACASPARALGWKDFLPAKTAKGP